MRLHNFSSGLTPKLTGGEAVRIECNVSEVIGPDVPKTVPKESRLYLMLPIQINKLGASF
jgi:hypothetical protein